jgi:hypothetical protein
LSQEVEALINMSDERFLGCQCQPPFREKTFNRWLYLLFQYLSIRTCHDKVIRITDNMGFSRSALIAGFSNRKRYYAYMDSSRFASISSLLDWGTTAHVYPAFKLSYSLWP